MFYIESFTYRGKRNVSGSLLLEEEEEEEEEEGGGGGGGGGGGQVDRPKRKFEPREQALNKDNVEMDIR